MQATRTFRLHIGIFGRRNVGKSSLLNALTGQESALVSPTPGTTTDPVEKSMELPLLGPVTLIDTAGIDDEGALGAQRVARTRLALQRCDLVLLVCDANWTAFEDELLAECRKRELPLLLLRNQSDLDQPPSGNWPAEPAAIAISSLTGVGLEQLRAAMVEIVPEDFINRPAILADLVPPGECALLVVPLDSAAPKGRLILPQVQSIRDLLDHDAAALVVKEDRIKTALALLARPPALVVTDSQVFQKVAADTPDEIPMTSFSILFARFQGDLALMVEGARAIEKLRPGDRVLIAEACGHHPGHEDIGTVKIPRWLNRHVGGELRFEFTRGRGLPDDLADFQLVVHCGACMWNRREMLARLALCHSAGVPVTNYGLTIAWSLGIFDRALRPFPTVSTPQASQ